MSSAVWHKLSTRKYILPVLGGIKSSLVCSLKSKHNQPQHIISMNQAFLRYESGSETFEMNFRYVNAELNIDRQFNLTRKCNETISNFLKRIETNMEKSLIKKKKKSRRKNNLKDTNEMGVESSNGEDKVILLKNNERVNGNTLCETLLNHSSSLQLIIMGIPYEISFNAPWVLHMALPACILAGFPTYPSKFEALHTDRLHSVFNWYKNMKNGNSKQETESWEEVGQGYFYTPSSEDIGCRLKLSCLPKNSKSIGPAVEVESHASISAGPGHCPFETRHLFTSNKLSGKSFRITSYNILADTYTDSDYSREVLFPYCPPYALDMDYRKQLIMKELMGYNADIICLQEVDNKVYDVDLYPTLSSLNYNGVYNRKGAGVTEGLSTFYNDERFEKLNFEFTVIGENLHLKDFASVWNTITNEKMKERFSERNTTVQITTLKSKEDPTKILLVGNTHLYFHPNADHIRLLQGYYALSYAHEVAKRTQEQNPDCNVSILLCGDFNSVPECGIYQLMTKRYVPNDCKDWSSCPEEIVENVSLSHSLSFDSACGTPEYTNYTAEFADCLDYIFYQTDNLKVSQVIPMPSNEELKLHTALPSVVFPSDHISLCVDLEWIK
ncbi:2',5'-phosphodiesterase 12 [Cephus cinctus]|uniref:2',5'-phosphodiesterase 12 n=1 Tax=Cephus cinctus TaxID=211228 RepID=A0AAJ7FPF8_CEPCN|nr:2',5'-phosphodiesterase 12 [Cephus cinctus]